MVSRWLIQLKGRKFSAALPVKRLMSCQSRIARSASGGELWNPRTASQPKALFCVMQRFAGRLAGFEYHVPHMAPPQPPSQLSVVWLLMYPRLVLTSILELGVICRL